MVDTHSQRADRGTRKVCTSKVSLADAKQLVEAVAHDRQNDRLLRRVPDLARERQAVDWLALPLYIHLLSSACLLSFLPCLFLGVPLAHHQVLPHVPIQRRRD